MLWMIVIIMTSWKVSMTSMFNVSMAYYNDSWQGDDASNVVWVLKLDGEAEKSITESLFYKNILSLAYGQTFLKDNATGNWLSPVKSTDKIENENTLILRKGWPVDPYTSLYFFSTFFDEENKKYVNPMTFQESFGFKRTIFERGESELATRVGVAFKQVLNQIDSISTLKEGGIEWITEGSFKLSDNTVYKANLRVFKAIMSNTSTSMNTWKTPDLKFENHLTVGVIKYINLSLYLMLFYDRDEVDKVQIKETMSLGLTFNIL